LTWASYLFNIGRKSWVGCPLLLMPFRHCEFFYFCIYRFLFLLYLFLWHVYLFWIRITTRCLTFQKITKWFTILFLWELSPSLPNVCYTLLAYKYLFYLNDTRRFLILITNTFNNGQLFDIGCILTKKCVVFTNFPLFLSISLWRCHQFASCNGV